MRRVAYYVVGLALAGLAVWSVSGKSDELTGARSYLSHLRWGWVLVALAAEILSYVSYGEMQRRLLRVGQVRASRLSLTGAIVAATAIQNTLPGGVILSAAYLFRRYRRCGADEVLAGWVVVSVAVLSFVSLALIAAVGVILALGSASALGLVAVVAGIVVLAVALVAAWVKRSVWLLWLAVPLRWSQRRLQAAAW